MAALVGAGFAVLWAWAIGLQSYNVWGAMVVVPAVIWVNAILIWRVASREPGRWLGAVMAGAFAAKMVGTLVRYYVAYVVYDGATDAERYNLAAAFQYRTWRQGVVTWDLSNARGTQYMELITTAVYTVIGPTTLAGFFVFASFAFWGVYLLYRAFRVALPGGDHRRYALLVFLLPSFLYWPSSIGKESWILLFVGVTALGAAKFFAGQRGALALLAIGAFGTGIIRPHIAVLLFAALLTAQLFRPASKEVTGILSKIAGLGVMVGAASILATQSAELLGTDDINWESVSAALDMAGGRTTQGGSEFTPVSLSSPLGVPMAAITVLFRPFPWEAGNGQMLVQSLEGVFLLVLAVRSWPRLKRLPGIMRRNPYVMFAVVYALAFVVAFAGFANFGILARQRVLLLPFFLVLLALPMGREDDQPEGTEVDAREEVDHFGGFRRHSLRA
ncbi:hypothetical protein N802_01105 [Knoellia sinensis KCTC 19936]|uniref:Glycosyltransferase RgtA/B/C/D-like domain-containing protein n=1 Tax=Knoellia sinensis KCTC 19936 TaxID=1385520 RepID=A0A0A0JBC0_9MICO|nr:hypothetical protein N802_01105 [Knoellia sinensis KCTC 19936]